MNIEAIPKTFWHTVSLCLLIVTIGLTYVAYKAEHFSIQYNEIELLANGNKNYKDQLDIQADNIAGQTQTIEKQRIELEVQRSLSKKRLVALKAAQNLINKLNVNDSKSTPNIEVKREIAVALEKEKSVELLLEQSTVKLEKLKVTQEHQQIQHQQQQKQVQQQQKQQQQIQQRF